MNSKDERFSRTRLLIGDEGLKRLNNSTVAVFGLGGVGGAAVEALARCGVGSLVLIDNDTVSESNLNRQIIALDSTLGMDKTDAAKARVLAISPDCRVETRKCFFLPENSAQFDFGRYDYVADAVDTVTAKIEIILKAKAAGVPVISSMGTGNKLDPTRLTVTDIYNTTVCPLARIMRRELKKRGVTDLKVVYSQEPPVPVGAGASDSQPGRRSVPGSVSFVPPVAGMIMAAEIIKDLIRSGS